MTQDEADREQAQGAVLWLYLVRRYRLRVPGQRKGDLPLNEAYHLDRTNRAAAAYFAGAPIVEFGFERRRNPERRNG